MIQVYLRDTGTAEDPCWVPCNRRDAGAIVFTPCGRAQEEVTMTALNKLRHTHTKTLRVLVTRIRRRQQRKQYVPPWQQFIASAALTIIKTRKGNRR